MARYLGKMKLREMTCPGLDLVSRAKPVWQEAYKGFSKYSLVLVFASICILGLVDDGACEVIPTVDSPGRFDYDLVEREHLWNLSDDYPSTDLITEDLDQDGAYEVIFGTRNGYVFVYSPDEKTIDLEYSVGARVVSLAVGDVDSDDDLEVLVSSSLGITCIDSEQGWAQWEAEEIDTSNGIFLSDVDEDGQQEIFVFNKTTPISETGYLTCLRANGDIEFSSPLTGWKWPPGQHVSLIFEDIDYDTEIEVVINDRGWSIGGERGCHIWVLDALDGDLERSREFEEFIFSSSALMYKESHEPFFYIGLETYASDSDYDLFVYDLFADNYSTYNISNKMEWRYCSLIEDDGPFILLASENGDLVCWSVDDRETSWSYDEVDNNGIFQAPFLCDIDSDARLEVLCSPRKLNVLNVTSGRQEAAIVVREGYIKKLRTICQDFNGDKYAEILVLYQDGISQEYFFSYLSSSSQFLHPDDGHPFPATLYAGIENSIHLVLSNTTVLRIPDTISMQFQNPEWGAFCGLTLHFNNNSIVNSDDAIMLGRSFSYGYNDRNMSLSLVVVPSWNFSYQEENSITTWVIGRTIDNMTDTFPEAFRVERDLVFSGEYQLMGSRQGSIGNGSWVATAEEITISRIGVVYEGTVGKAAPLATFNISLQYSGIIKEWAVDSQWIVLVTPDETGPIEITLSLFQVPLVSFSSSELAIQLGIDGNPPILRDSFPENNTWYINKEISYGITIDDEESGLNTSSVRFVIYPSEEDGELHWINIDISKMTKTQDGHSIIDEGLIFDGTTNISWSAHDNVGNPFLFTIQIRFDDTKIQFRDFTSPEWSNSSEVSCSITILDLNGSGVDGTSLQYSYSTDGVASFSEWISIENISSDDMITVNVSFIGKEGDGNYIRFRGHDVAGTQYITSATYNILVDTIPPLVTIEFPGSNAIIPNRTIIARIYESGSGIEKLTPSLQNAANGVKVDVEYTISQLSEDEYLVNFTWNLSDPFRFSFNLTCFDKALNYAHSGPLHFQENRPPLVDIIKPQDRQTFFIGESISLEIEYTDPNQETDLTIEWYLDGSPIGMGNNISLSINMTGNHRIEVVIKDSYFEEGDSVEISIDKRKTSIPKWSYLILLLILISIVVVAYHFRSKTPYERE